jgi:hypothetical protein
VHLLQQRPGLLLLLLLLQLLPPLLLRQHVCSLACLQHAWVHHCLLHVLVGLLQH